MEFFGPGVAQLSIADRATISNMCPEYGATVGFFPVDEYSIQYLNQTGKCASRFNYAYVRYLGVTCKFIVSATYMFQGGMTTCYRWLRNI